MSPHYEYVIGAEALLIPKPIVTLGDCTPCLVTLVNSHSWLTEVGDYYEINTNDATLVGTQPSVTLNDVSV